MLTSRLLRRPVFLTTSLIGFIWAMVVGVEGIQDLDDWNSKHFASPALCSLLFNAHAVYLG